MYAMMCARPNLSHAMSVVSHYMYNPGRDHWKAMKWILRYVKGSIDRALVFDRNKAGTWDVVYFVDSDYAGDLDRRRSFLGCIYTICAGAISWKALLLSIIALSTMEAKYVAITEGLKEATWFRSFVTELGVP